MASLKEVKNRIQSVRTTRKITQARQMVSSAQLHRAQADLERARAYRDELEALLRELVPDGESADEPSEDQTTAVIVMASDSGMCGSFNLRMIKEMERVAGELRGRPAVFCPIGKKVRDAARAQGLRTGDDFDCLLPKADWHDAAMLFSEMMTRYKRIEVLFFDFRHVSSQQIVRRTILPVAAPEPGEPMPADYIVEPSVAEVVRRLVPMVAFARFYYALSSSRASEHASRMVAMQLATENANELLDELQLSYNKLRQQNITSELLDIIGSSFA